MTIAELRPEAVAPTHQHEPHALRDTGIDLVRALCVLGVVVLHALMVGVTVTDAGPLFANASDGAAWITPVSWILQVMPLFFVIGGFAGYTSYRRTQRDGGLASRFIAARIRRLILPAVCTIAIIGIALTALLLIGVPLDLVTIAGYRFSQPLWFLAVFLMCQVLLPAMATVHRRAPWLTLTLLVMAAVLVDAARVVTGVDGVGFVNLAFVWLAMQQLGFFFADGTIDSLTRRTRVTLAMASVGALAFAFGCGIYSPDLIANINPPTTALLLVGIAHTMLLSLMRRRLSAWSRLPVAARFREFVTPRAMTLYLWHMPVLLTMAGASAVFAIMTGTGLPEPSSVQWWATRPLWIATALTLTTCVAIVFATIEARRVPAPTPSAFRLSLSSALALSGVVGLLVYGTTPLTALIAVGLMVLSLRLARLHTSRRAAIRAIASVMISGLVPKFSRTWPAPSAPNAGP